MRTTSARFAMALGSLVLLTALAGRGLTAAAPPRVTATAPLPLPPLLMEDQYERPRQLAGYLGHVVVLVYGDRASADANRQLGEMIHVHFHPSARNLPPEKALNAPPLPLPGMPPETPAPDVVALPIACIGKVPGFMHNIIRGQIRKGSPYLPVWLDFEDQMKTRFGLAAGVPNIVIVDSQGRQRYTGSGALNQEEVGRLLQAITTLRYEGAKGNSQ